MSPSTTFIYVTNNNSTVQGHDHHHLHLGPGLPGRLCLSSHRPLQLFRHSDVLHLLLMIIVSSVMMTTSKFFSTKMEKPKELSFPEREIFCGKSHLHSFHLHSPGLRGLIKGRLKTQYDISTTSALVVIAILKGFHPLHSVNPFLFLSSNSYIGISYVCIGIICFKAVFKYCLSSVSGLSSEGSVKGVSSLSSVRSL